MKIVRVINRHAPSISGVLIGGLSARAIISFNESPVMAVTMLIAAGVLTITTLCIIAETSSGPEL